MDADTVPKKMATLETIKYEALVQKDPLEIQKLVNASKNLGMFYLDLRGPSTELIFEDMPTIFKTANNFFSLPQNSNEKMESLCEGMERGYHAGKGFEYYEIAQNEFQLGKWTLPATFEPEQDRLARIIQIFSHSVQTILWELCAAADIKIPELSDDPVVPSDTALKIVYKPPIHDAGKVIHPWHTDFGLITLLWYDEETTQIPTNHEKGPPTEDCETIPVIDGCVLINVADHLASKSRGIFHSTTHRVVAPPGPKRTRNGMIYLLRPYST
ncbi:oxidoreductase [Phaeosphaeriaceae sp. PMI808]|nr:oxidoreductase [Phaeosphaeriaceae sp. PMI808]